MGLHFEPDNGDEGGSIKLKFKAKFEADVGGANGGETALLLEVMTDDETVATGADDAEHGMDEKLRKRISVSRISRLLV